MVKIAIDAGHGNHTPGKRSPCGTLREFHFNRVVAAYLAEMLKGYENVETLFVHDHQNGTDVPLGERTRRANTWGATAYISIHANAFGSGAEWTSPQGIETFIHTNASTTSVRLGGEMQKELIKQTGRPNRGVKRANFHVLRETRMPAVLPECGFMTNRVDFNLLMSDDYRKKCAQAMADALVTVYSLKLKKEDDILKVAIYLNSPNGTGAVDYGVAEELASRLRCPIYPPGTGNVINAEKVILIGGTASGVRAKEVIDLSGDRRIPTYKNVIEYIERGR